MSSTYAGAWSRPVKPWRAPRNPVRDPYADIVTLLAAVLTDSTKLPGAACTTAPELFAFDADDQLHAEAVQICASCPALDACRSWVASLPTGHVSGVIAGEIHKPMYLKKRRHP